MHVFLLLIASRILPFTLPRTTSQRLSQSHHNFPRRLLRRGGSVTATWKYWAWTNTEGWTQHPILLVHSRLQQQSEIVSVRHPSLLALLASCKQITGGCQAALKGALDFLGAYAACHKVWQLLQHSLPGLLMRAPLIQHPSLPLLVCSRAFDSIIKWALWC